MSSAFAYQFLFTQIIIINKYLPISQAVIFVTDINEIESNCLLLCSVYRPKKNCESVFDKKNGETNLII